MSNYSKTTDFASKDALASGNPSKVIKGTEHDTEYNAIAVAIATKADLNSPVLVTPNLGTPSAGVMTNVTGTAAGLTAGGNALLAGSASQAFAASAFTAGDTSEIPFNSSSAITTRRFLNIDNLSGDIVLGVDGSAGNAMGTGTTAYSAVFGCGTNKDVHILQNNIVRATFNASGMTGNVTGNVTGDLLGSGTIASGVAATTQAVGTNNLSIATTAFCDAGFVNNDVSYGAVGSFIFGYNGTVNTGVVADTTYAGSAIVASGLSLSASGDLITIAGGDTPIGTWRCLGSSPAGGAGFYSFSLFQRIS